MSKSKTATPAPVAAFFVKVGRLQGASDRSGARFVQCNGTGKQIADALDVPGVFDVWHLPAVDEIGMILEDSSKVHPFIFQGGGMTITTTDQTLIAQLSALPVECCEPKEPHWSALKALGVMVPKPARVYPDPVKAISVWFKFSGDTRQVVDDRRACTAALEASALELLRKLREVGVVALGHVDGAVWKVTGYNLGDCRTAIGYDQGRLVVSTDHPDAVRILSGDARQAVLYGTVFSAHSRIFPSAQPTVETVDDREAAERAHNLAALQRAQEDQAYAELEASKAEKAKLAAKRRRTRATQPTAMAVAG